MQNTLTNQRRFRLALGAGASFGVLAFASMASAQQVETVPPAAEAEAASGDSVIVTGSRIRRADAFDSITPTVSVDGLEIQARGYDNVIEGIEQLPFVGPGSNSQGPQVQFGDNFSFPDILNLGTQRTLTLVNGHRFVSANQGTVFVPANASGAQVDLTIINPALVERTEVVVGTGGPVYGADAVSGVVNVILKDDFEGFDGRITGGITQGGGGENYRFSGAYGKNFFGDRLNVTVAGDYFNQESIRGDQRNFSAAEVAGVVNPLNGARNEEFDAASAVAAVLGGGAVPNAFLPLGADGQPSTVFVPNGRTPFINSTGLFVTNNLITGGNTNTPFFPNTNVTCGAACATADPQGLAFFAPTALPPGVTGAQVFATLAPGVSTAGLTAAQVNALGLQLLRASRPTPFEFAQTSAGAAIDPLLFVGSFGPTSGLFPRLPNTDPSTSGILPFRSVPLQFDAAGNLVAFNVGDIAPPNPALVGTTIGGDSRTLNDQRNLLSATERSSFNLLTKYEISPNLTYKTEFVFADLNFDSIVPVNTNNPAGSVQAGGRSIPIFINENPFLTAQAQSTIADLQAQGLTLPTVGGAPVIYLSRELRDVQGGFGDAALRNRTFATTHTLAGEFEQFGKNFYWDAIFGYGRNRSTNRAEQLLDIEFALATDVVADANGNPVCRQQTLAAPESILVRNPGLNGLNTLLPLTPTQAQIDACVPLNLLGGAVTQEAADYVLTSSDSTNLSQQYFGSTSLGGELFQLPAGPFAFNAQFEWRRETLDFQPNEIFATGAARNTAGGGGLGRRRFFEGGFEGKLPIFGGDVQPAFFDLLELEGAVRVVSRAASTDIAAIGDSPGTLDVTFSAGGRYSPFEGLTFRGNRTRSVRSGSIVELVGAAQTGFTGLVAANNPCNQGTIDQGPNPATRRANCIQTVIDLGLATDQASATTFLAGFQATGATVPAIVVGNPGLRNEQSDAFTVGVEITPSFIPNFRITGDFFSIDIADQLGLVGPAATTPTCFDSPDFPFADFGGQNACGLFTFGVFDPVAGQFVIPAVNPVTGTAIASNAGAPAAVQTPLNIAQAAFPNLNQGSTELRAINVTVQYSFGLSDVLGSMANSWGDIGIIGRGYLLRRYDVFATNDASSLNVARGEPENPRFNTRIDLSHSVGKFNHSFQWFYRSPTVLNAQTAPELFPEQSVAFQVPAINTFNYNIAYDINDNFTARFVVNNITNTFSPLPQFQAADVDINEVFDPLGRRFQLSLQARF